MEGRSATHCSLPGSWPSMEGRGLNWKHLSLAIKTAADFDKYLKKVKGYSDDQWVREERLR